MGIQILAVAVGGAIGSTLRYLVTLGAARVVGAGFPVGTLLVNLVGCLIAGTIFGLAEERAALPTVVRILLLTGFAGGFTTFSAYAVESVALFRDGHWVLGLASVAANNLAGGALALGGVFLGRLI